MFCLSTETIKRPTCIVNYRYIVIFAGIYNSIPVLTVNISKYPDGRCPSLDFNLYLLIISLNLTFLSDRCSLLFDGALRSPETHGIFPNPRGDSVFLAGCFVVGLVLD